MKAILKNGLIHPKEPVPSDWSDGTELEVQKSASGTSEFEARFRRLKAQWRGDTFVLSDPNKIMGHPAMRAIIAMGEAVVPIILRDLRDDPSLLVWALPKITGENLAPPKIEDGFAKWNIAAETEAWLNWGRVKGLL
jgi:hypothetical protein